MEPVRVALIGGGFIGDAHLDAATASAEGSIVAICDADPARKDLAEKLQVPFYTDYRELLARDDIEAVINATPNQLHAEIGIACAGRGLHLLTEKPFAATLDEGKRLLAASQAAGTVHIVGHHRRHYPRVGRAREIVRGGSLGRLIALNVMWAAAKPDYYYQTAWRSAPGGGPVLINHIHDIDNVRFICGEFASVNAAVRRQARSGAVEDTAVLTFELEDGALGTALVSDTTPSPWAYEINSGEDLAFQKNDTDCYRFLGDEASLSFPRMEIWRYTEQREKGWWGPVEVEVVAIAHENAIHNEFRNFCNAIRGLEEPLAPAEEGLKTLAVAFAIHESSKRGGPVSPRELLEG